MVNFPGLAGFEHDTDAGSSLLAYQVMMHGADGEQRAHRDPGRTDCPVGKNDQAVALGNRTAGLRADPVQSGDEAVPAGPRLERDVYGARTPTPVVHLLDGGKFLVGQDGMRHPQPMGVLLGGFQQIALGADVALQRHDHFLADGVDGRVGYLGKTLFEIVVDHARLVGHHRKRGVVAHGSQGVAQLLDEGLEHDLHGLYGVAERLHARRQGLGMETVGIVAGRDFR